MPGITDFAALEVATLVVDSSIDMCTVGLLVLLHTFRSILFSSGPRCSASWAV